jgi:hypothetical protein
MYFGKKQSGGRVYPQIVESRRIWGPGAPASSRRWAGSIEDLAMMMPDMGGRMPIRQAGEPRNPRMTPKRQKSGSINGSKK